MDIGLEFGFTVSCWGLFGVKFLRAAWLGCRIAQVGQQTNEGCRKRNTDAQSAFRVGLHVKRRTIRTERPLKVGAPYPP